VHIYSAPTRETATRDSLIAALIENYPDSPQGRAARRLREPDAGPPLTVSGLSPSEGADFLHAESVLFQEGEPLRAIEAYRDFMTKHPSSTYLPKSMYAVGWIQENRLGQNRQAFDSYRLLMEKFPESAFAKDLKVKIAAAEKEFKIAGSDKAATTALPEAAAAAADSLSAGENIDELDSPEAIARRKLLEKDEMSIRRPPKPDDQPND
jgi:hypothetical protein